MKLIFPDSDYDCENCGTPVHGKGFRINSKWYCDSCYEIHSPQEKKENKMNEKRRVWFKKFIGGFE